MGSISHIFVASGMTTAATTAAAFAFGNSEVGKPAAPLNATSHIVWGDEAATHDDFDLSHTLVGGVLNAGAMVAWSSVHALMFGGAKKTSLFGALVGGVGVAALAYVTDYYLVPKRFTPGFEKRLSGRALAMTYGVLALSLAVSSLISAPRAK